jgi:glucose-1-phosphate thymidylyltransferase
VPDLYAARSAALQATSRRRRRVGLEHRISRAGQTGGHRAGVSHRGKFHRLGRGDADFKSGATIFGYHVHDPERYGVVEFDADGKAVSIEEKPKSPKSNYAVPGLYICDNQVVEIAKNLKPSARGELEITAVNVEYLRLGKLRVQRLTRGFAWLDAGTSSSLHDASAYVQTIEKRAGIKIGCPEEAAFRQSFVSLAQLDELTKKIPNCEYRDYLAAVVAEAKRLQK